MEYTKQLALYPFGAEREDELNGYLSRARELSSNNATGEVYRRCFACLDLTSLGADDTPEGVRRLVRRSMELRGRYDDIPGVAAVCVFPSLVDSAGLELGDSATRIASVAGGFPYAQTYLEVKMLEVAMAVENGADEIDTVMNPGAMLAGRYDALGSEIALIRDEVGGETTLKVIIESGLLAEAHLIYTASVLAMLAGADFVKTSTGKTAVGATPEAVAAMCVAVRDFHRRTGRRVGVKVAGGVRTTAAAVLYYSIVEAVLGAEWLTPGLFRIGASSLANDLITSITGDPAPWF